MTSKIKVDNINKVSDDSNIINKCGTTITLGASGDSIALASGASQTGFGRTGTVDWQTGSIKTTTFTAANGEGYFCNTSGGAFTATLPSSPSAGDIVAFADYTRTFGTNKLTIGRNSQPIGGIAFDAELTNDGQSATFVYVDGTEGWININETQTSVSGKSPYIVATGGTIVTCGNLKTHIFTGPGTFAVTCAGQSRSSCVGDNRMDYLVVAGGGGGGCGAFGSGAGAGGFRMSNVYSLPSPTTSPLANPTGITASSSDYPITVGGGGANCSPYSTSGSVSIFSTITSAGGAGGRKGQTPLSPGADGASGSGGTGAPGAGGSGNTPPVSPPQGNNGGQGNDGAVTSTESGGGGGAGAVGTNGSGGQGGPGGVGSFIADGFVGPTAPTYGSPGPVGSTRYFAGGGGGATDRNTTLSTGGSGGGGGGGSSPAFPTPTYAQGVVNTGGGGGGHASAPVQGGGSGIVMIRYRFQN